MFYSEKDIDFTQISPKEFENLCYELIIANNFQNVVWRQGGADSGRDIEASLPFNSPMTSGLTTRWFFECKHYTKGVPAEELNSKIAWADAENPDFLVILTTTFITTSAKQWLEKIQPQKHYRILIIEGEEIKSRLTTIQHLIPKYFSSDKYLSLYRDILRHAQLYRINPSMRVLLEIIQNIPAEKFELKDIGFLLYAYYECIYEEERDRDPFDPISWTDSIKTLPDKLLQQLKKISTQTDLSTYFKDMDIIEGMGCIEQVENGGESNKNYQTYWIHLNYSKRNKWKTAKYILVVLNKQESLEIIMPDDKQAFSFYQNKLTPKLLENILGRYCSEDTIEELKENAPCFF